MRANAIHGRALVDVAGKTGEDPGKQKQGIKLAASRNGVREFNEADNAREL